MPEISRFFGIVVTMYNSEHPPPHFHVRYQEQRAEISIADCEVIDGHVSPRVLRLVKEWHELHKYELAENWRRFRADEEFFKIEPLR